MSCNVIQKSPPDVGSVYSAISTYYSLFVNASHAICFVQCPHKEAGWCMDPDIITNRLASW